MRLDISGLSVRRGGAEIVHNVSLSVETGEVVALLGANGVGKSTTLRTISGLHRPVAGEIRLGGTRLDGLAPPDVVRHGVAHVPEGRQIFPGLSVLENLQIGAQVAGGLTDAKRTAMFAMFPVLGQMSGRMAGILSGGQQQMLTIARGLVSGPKVILLDEPSLGLAPKIVTEIGQTIGELARTGLGVVLVEQNATMALDLASHAYLMSAGRIVADGPAHELRESAAVRDVYFSKTSLL